MIKIKNKKASGMFPSEIIKIVLAALCLALLIYLGVQLYGIFTQDSEYKQAQATLEQISIKINNLGVGEKEASYLISSPKNWILLIQGQSLCICPKAKELNEQTSKCGKEGICQNMDLTVYIKGSSEGCCLMGGKDSAPQLNECLDFYKMPRTLYIYKAAEDRLIFSFDKAEYYLPIGVGTSSYFNATLQKTELYFPRSLNWPIPKLATVYAIDFQPYILLDKSALRAGGCQPNRVEPSRRFLYLEQETVNEPIYIMELYEWVPALSESYDARHQIFGVIDTDGAIYLNTHQQDLTKNINPFGYLMVPGYALVAQDGYYIADKRFSSGYNPVFKSNLKTDYNKLSQLLQALNQK